MGFLKYIKAAFTNRWNLLALAGSVGFAALSGHAEVAVPLVMAAEVAYLGLLGTHEKFRKAIDAQQHKQARAAQSQTAEQALRSIMLALPRKSKQRYKDLAERCQKLRRIASNLHAPAAGSLDDLQLEGLDKLLWIHLKLLYTEYMLGEFLTSTDENRIQSEVSDLEKRIAREEARPENEQRTRILATLRDDLSTCNSRLANYQKASQNHELVKLEIRRLENKIKSLSEMAINRKEPDFVSDQVDEVATSMFETEKTLNELEFVTGLHSEQDDAVPKLLRRATVKTRR